MENNISHENVHKYLPSKKIQIAIGVIVIVAVLYGLRNPIINLKNRIFNKQAQPIVTLTAPVVSPEQGQLSIDKDTDGDGLPDWQEVLLGTDPKVPNSKTDVPDSVRELVNTSKDIVTTEDKLALKVYQRLLTEPKGNNISEALQAATSKEVLDYANSIDQQLTTYTIDDINLVDDTPDSRLAYQNSAGPLVKAAIPSQAILQDSFTYLSTGTAKITVSNFQINLTQTTNKLLQVPVPLGLVEEHLILLNAIAHMNGILNNSSKPSSDPSTLYANILVFEKNFNATRGASDTLAKMLAIPN